MVNRVKILCFTQFGSTIIHKEDVVKTPPMVHDNINYVIEVEKVKRRVLCIVLALVLAITIFPMAVFAESNTVVKSGSCGENLTWVMYEGGRMVVTGEGSMVGNSKQIDWHHKEFIDPEWVDVTSVELDSRITTITEAAFYHCNKLKQIYIPDGVRIIGNCAFKGSGLTEISLPDSIITISAMAFQHCDNLRKAFIGSGCENLVCSAFSCCPNLKSFIVSDGNTKFASVDGVVFSKDLTHLFAVPGAITEYSIPDGTRSVGQSAFCNSPNLVSVSIPKSCSSFDYSVFESCTSLKEVIAPQGIRPSPYMFNGCKALKEIVLQAVNSIGSNTFNDCPSLTDVWYLGNGDEWSKVSDAGGNDDLFNATIHYTIDINYVGGNGCSYYETEKGISNTPVTITAINLAGSDGYEFQGWSRTNDATEPEFLPGSETKFEDDVTLYGVWHKHVYDNWKSDGATTHSRTCACGHIDTQLHQWDQGTVTKRATIFSYGEKTYTCTVCGQQKTERINKVECQFLSILRDNIDNFFHNDKLRDWLDQYK